MLNDQIIGQVMNFNYLFVSVAVIGSRIYIITSIPLSMRHHKKYIDHKSEKRNTFKILWNIRCSYEFESWILNERAIRRIMVAKMKLYRFVAGVHVCTWKIMQISIRNCKYLDANSHLNKRHQYICRMTSERGLL